MWRRLCCAGLLGAALLASHAAGGATVTVGSKNFNESYLLAEMAAQLLEHAGHVGNLEEDDRVLPLTDRPPNELNELPSSLDVFQRVATADEIGL